MDFIINIPPLPPIEMGSDPVSQDQQATPPGPSTIFQKFTQWFAANEPTSNPERIESFYLLITQKTYDALLKEKSENPLDPFKKFVLGDVKLRLVELDIPNDGTVPAKAYNGFLHCELIKLDPRDYSGHLHPIHITPKDFTGIFIADCEPATRYKTEISEANPAARYLTDEQYIEFERRLGRTLLPIDQYQGGYKDPIVLIEESRTLSLGEIEIVKSDEQKESRENLCQIQ